LLGIRGSNPNAVAPPPRRRANLPANNERRYMPNEILIEIASDVPESTIESIVQRFGLIRVSTLSVDLLGTTLHRWRVTGGRSVSSIINALAGEGVLRSIQPNNLYLAGQATSQAQSGAVQPPPSPAEAQIELGKKAVEISIPQSTAPESEEPQYALAKLRLPAAHRLVRGENILVAVIDSGIDDTHPDLANIIAGRFDAVGGEDEPHSHGTAVAGAIVANGKLVGAAPAARLLAIRAFEPVDKGAVGTTFNIVRGLDWAANQGARIVNMSFAGPADPLLERAFVALSRRGMVLVAAAGNGGPKSPAQYPAADPNVIAVTATDADDRLFPAANRGKYVAVAAPGVDILLPAPDARYQITSGTSIAAAEVSGVVALLVQRRHALNPADVRWVLLRTAKDLGPKGRDDQFGAGLTDAYGAVISLAPVTAGAPSTPAANR
jgi:subtilisin family serine protease